MDNPYDRQILAEHVMACSRSRRRVEVAIGEQRWVLDDDLRDRYECPDCGARMVKSSSTPSGDTQVCVRCAIEESATEIAPPSAQQLTI